MATVSKDTEVKINVNCYGPEPYQGSNLNLMLWKTL